LRQVAMAIASTMHSEVLPLPPGAIVPLMTPRW